MVSLQRLFSLTTAAAFLGKATKVFPLAEISLEMRILGEMLQVKGYLFLTFLLEKGLDEGEF